MTKFGAHRLDTLPAYLFNQLEWKATAMREAGIDVIPLAFGDPDEPTHPPIVEAARQALLDPGTHRYSTNRGRPEFREAVSGYYARRFGVPLNPHSMVIPALGAKEVIFNINLAFLDPGDVALAPDPGYQIYTAGPVLVGANPYPLPLRADNGYLPDLGAIPASTLQQARVLYLNYPNTPTGAAATSEFFIEVVDFAARHDILVVHDNVYSDITFDGYLAPSFLATPGALEVGVEVISLSKTFNMTGWRCAALVGNADALDTYRRLKTFVDSGMFGAVQLAGVAALDPEMDSQVAESVIAYERRRDLVCSIFNRAGIKAEPPKGGVYVWAELPGSFGSSFEFCEYVLDVAAVATSPGAAYGPNGEGHFRMSLTVADDRLQEAAERIVAAIR